MADTFITSMLLILLFAFSNRNFLITTVLLMRYIELVRRCSFGYWLSSVAIN